MNSLASILAVVCLTGTGFASDAAEASKDLLGSIQEEVALLRDKVLELESKGPGAQAPRMGFDSGWIPLTSNTTLLTHNVGGDTDRYLVFFDQRSANYGTHKFGDGLVYPPQGEYGASYQHLTSSDVVIYWGKQDAWVEEV